MNVSDVAKQYLNSYLMEEVRCPFCNEVNMRWMLAGSFPGCTKCLKKLIESFKK